jgi:hypothetical protein
MLLFVYGTLRRGFNGEMAARLAAESEWIGAGCVPNAQLYQIASRDFDYPALVLLSPAEKQGNGGDKEEPVIKICKLKYNKFIKSINLSIYQFILFFIFLIKAIIKFFFITAGFG